MDQNSVPERENKVGSCADDVAATATDSNPPPYLKPGTYLRLSFTGRHL